ncbi:DUF932 domain-containing protein [Kribbella sp. NPDC048928]|uniref:DUF932 domain-containing protein n=1 Tax=Kribbella sp. NPDC048928 TaxID=3364111 RepID=UPI00371E5A9E
MTVEQTYPTPDETTLRNSDLRSLMGMLQSQHTEKLDFVAPAANIRAEEGLIVVNGSEAELTEDGVTQVNGTYRPTSTFLNGLAGKLQVPVGYLKKIHAERPDLFDANVNGWLQGARAKTRLRNGRHELIREGFPGMDRSFLMRTFQGTDGPGLGRAFLSEHYKMLDNLDALMAMLDGVRKAGVEIDIRGCDLTESRMYVRIRAQEIKAYAPTLLKGYRSPFTGATGDENPTVFAGFVISNSEVGGGAYTIAPQLVVQVCDNGMTITKDIRKEVHRGGLLADGLIRWSDETRRKEIDLVRAKTTDAVKTFLDVDYVTRTIEALEHTATKPLNGAADKVVRTVGKKLAFSEDQIAGILDHFIAGGQRTAGGVMQAVTSYAQIIRETGSADTANEVEAQGIRAMELAAA